MKVKLLAKAFLLLKAMILALPAIKALRAGHRITPDDMRRAEGQVSSEGSICKSANRRGRRDQVQALREGGGL